MDILELKAQEQIWENAYEINHLLNELVTEKFGPSFTCDKLVMCHEDNTFDPSTSDSVLDCKTLSEGA